MATAVEIKPGNYQEKVKGAARGSVFHSTAVVIHFMEKLKDKLSSEIVHDEWIPHFLNEVIILQKLLCEAPISDSFPAELNPILRSNVSAEDYQRIQDSSIDFPRSPLFNIALVAEPFPLTGLGKMGC